MGLRTIGVDQFIIGTWLNTASAATGEWPAAVDTADFARYITTVIQGLAVQAASGAQRKALHRVVKLAMAAWPNRT